MQRESALVGGLVVVVLAMLLGAAVIPGVMAESNDDVRPSHFDIREDEGSIRAVDVSGATVTLQIETRLHHGGGTGDNVSIGVRAIDTETGLLADRNQTSLGTVAGEREESVMTNITVERQGGYRIETFVYENGITKTEERRSISGVGSLTPEYAKSSIVFHDFQSGASGPPSIDHKIESVRNERVTLNVSTYLTNEGNEPAGDVTVALKARQAESNVVADRTTLEAGSIRAGRTVSPSAQLTVPDGYNYWLDAVLLKDGVVVDTISEPANLDPEETLQKGERKTDTGFQSKEFAGTDRPRRGSEATEVTTEGSGPGFGPGLALVALVGAALLAVRRKNND